MGEQKKGIVHIVGGGCGDYDLISLRGLRLLKNCQCVIFDSLIDKRLLDFVPENAEKISVGKRCGKHSEKQENINALLVKKALEGKIVVRLKGGDPFVFGRGGEEIISLKEYEIPYTIVPGITSSVAVPELAGIPVTHRKIARKFTVMTGHTADDESVFLDIDLKKTGTLICLMGLRKLNKICTALLDFGNSPETPAAVISDGASARQKILRGNLCDIAQKSVQAGIKSPAVIVFGDTAGFDFLPSKNGGALGCSVAVTGTKSFGDRLENALCIYGANVHRLDYVNIDEYKNIPLFDKAVSGLEKNSWLVFTSANGVEIFMKRLHERSFDFRNFFGKKFAAIGNATAKTLENYGIYADLIPQNFTCECLGKTLAETVREDEKVYIFRAEKGSEILCNILDSSNICYEDIHLYDLVYSPPLPEKSVIEDDYIVFGSSMGVSGFFDCGYKPGKNTKVISLGQVTSKKLKEYGISDCLTAEKPDVNSIVKLILEEEK